MALEIAKEQAACERMGTGSDQFAGGLATQTDREVPVPILSPRGTLRRRLLELGCGLGLVSLAAIRAGFEVTATDYYDEALAFTELNARHNDLTPPAKRLVDWRRFPEDLGRFDLVVASDVLFEKPNIPLIAAAFSRTFAPGGRGLLTDPGRPPAAAFPAECATPRSADHRTPADPNIKTRQIRRAPIDPLLQANPCRRQRAAVV